MSAAANCHLGIVHRTPFTTPLLEDPPHAATPNHLGPAEVLESLQRIREIKVAVAPRLEGAPVTGLLPAACQGFDSGKIVKEAYSRYNVSLGVGLSSVAGKVFRIGHLGNNDEVGHALPVIGFEPNMALTCSSQDSIGPFIPIPVGVVA